MSPYYEKIEAFVEVAGISLGEQCVSAEQVKGRHVFIDNTAEITPGGITIPIVLDDKGKKAALEIENTTGLTDEFSRITVGGSSVLVSRLMEASATRIDLKVYEGVPVITTEEDGIKRSVVFHKVNPIADLGELLRESKKDAEK